MLGVTVLSTLKHFRSSFGVHRSLDDVHSVMIEMIMMVIGMIHA